MGETDVEVPAGASMGKGRGEMDINETDIFTRRSKVTCYNKLKRHGSSAA